MKHTEYALEEVLVEHSTLGRGHLKKKLYKYGVKKRICEMCGQTEEWKGRKISLILDHINGINDDCREDNLRILCPNCNASLDTNGGKNMKNQRPVIPCEVCGKATKKPKFCSRGCYYTTVTKDRPHTRKVERPTKGQLEDLLSKTSTVAVGKLFGVSDNAVNRWRKRYNIGASPNGIRQQALTLSCGGSNPSAPAIYLERT